MSHVTGSRPISKTKLREWFARGGHRLYAYRPRFRDWRFWVVQGLVLLIAATHSFFEVQGLVHKLGVLYFIPLSLFLVPVVYAALVFDFVGAMATALWATVITIPSFVIWHHGAERFWEMFQMLIVVAMAFFVGQQVDRQRKAWQRAEAAATALKASNIKYRNLLDSSPVAILVIDQNGAVLEANSAASILFNRDKATLESMQIAELVGTSSAEKLLDFSHNGGQLDSLALKLKNGIELNIEPSLTEAGDEQGNSVIQLLLRDVTEEHHRQAGLKAYAAHVMSAQEEERQRVARELHDDTIQALVLICRRLDSVEADGKSLLPSQLNSLREVRKAAEEVVKGLRDFTKALRPPILDDLGLMASIRRLLGDFTERSRIEGKLKVVGEDQRLPSDTELVIFRIAQEALRNAELHSKATRVTITLTFARHSVRLEVVDNGAGFSIPSNSGDFIVSGHLGLISMQERADLLDGKLEIKSSPGKGTRVTVSVPVADVTSKVSLSRNLPNANPG